MASLNIAPYTGWTPRSMRMGRNRSETSDRSAKRSRLGNARDRFLYKSAKGWKSNPTRYGQLCVVANHLHGIRG